MENETNDISRMTDTEIESCAVALEAVRDMSGSSGPFKLDETTVAAILRDYIRLRKRDRILETLLAVDLSKSEAPYHSNNVWGFGKHHKDCGCNLYGKKAGDEVIGFEIKNKVKEYGSVAAAEEELDRRSTIYEAIMTGMNALVTAQEENRRLMENEGGGCAG